MCLISLFAYRCDQQGLGVDDRLRRVAETLERMVESFTPRSYGMAAGGSPETAKTSSSNNGGSTSDGGLSERGSSHSAFTDKVGGELLRRGSEEMLEDLHEIDAASIGDETRNFNAIMCKTRFGPKLEQSFLPTSSTGSALAAASSAGSLTPRSPLATPRISQIDVLLSDRNSFNEVDDPVQVCNLCTLYHVFSNSDKSQLFCVLFTTTFLIVTVHFAGLTACLQINELADIARCIAGAQVIEDGAEYLMSCLQDLQDVLRCNKVEALTVATFGKRIEKLCT